MQKPRFFEVSLQVADRTVIYRAYAPSRQIAEQQARDWAEKCVRPDDRQRNLQHRHV